MKTLEEETTVPRLKKLSRLISLAASVALVLVPTPSVWGWETKAWTHEEISRYGEQVLKFREEKNQFMVEHPWPPLEEQSEFLFQGLPYYPNDIKCLVRKWLATSSFALQMRIIIQVLIDTTYC